MKKYKEKLSEWRSWKYLPKDVAQWMLHKAGQRSRPDSEHPKGKETQFGYGALILTRDDVQKRNKRANFGRGEHVDSSKAILIFLALTNTSRRRSHAKGRYL